MATAKDSNEFPPYADPATLAEAEQRIAECVLAIEGIQTQLGNQNRVVGDQRMTSHAYWTWRHKAIAARGYRTEELRKLKAWRKAYHESTAKRFEQTSLGEMMAQARTAIHGQFDSVKALTADLTQKASENDELRARIAALETGLDVTSGNGRR